MKKHLQPFGVLLVIMVMGMLVVTGGIALGASADASSAVPWYFELWEVSQTSMVG